MNEPSVLPRCTCGHPIDVHELVGKAPDRPRKHKTCRSFDHGRLCACAQYEPEVRDD